MNTERIWKKTGALTLAAMVGCGSAAAGSTAEETAAQTDADSGKLETALTSTSFGK